MNHSDFEIIFKITAITARISIAVVARDAYTMTSSPVDSSVSIL